MTTTPPSFDPELGAVFAAVLAPTGQTSVATGITPEMLGAAREALDEITPSLEELAADERFELERLGVPGPAGEVGLLILRPKGLDGPRPVVYYVHGGGLMLGTNRYGLGPTLDLAHRLRLVVVSVEYRLAPEHPFPAGLDDAYAGLAWVAEHAGRVSGDPGRIILAGASAGGTLAAALALLARDRGRIAVLAQLLMYPMLDDRNDTVSARQMRGLGVWDDISNETGWAAWLGDAAGSDEPSPYAVPGRAPDLAGLPPALLDVGSAETFRDEVAAFAGRIWAAGGDAELHVWPGAFHGADTLAPHAAIVQHMQAARLNWLLRQLGE
ncbi:alpha/beta hydrolase [Dactylosporangium sp. CA-092794]|uniref:alpha/beta hydrolase n=1 Tax=Dactylosporangium sp. CA-092794 TaxID=3239929 RepID=UPI003D8E136D